MLQHAIKTGKHQYPLFQDEVRRALSVSSQDGGVDEPRTQLIFKGVLLDLSLEEVNQSGWILAYGKPYRCGMEPALRP